MNRDIEVTEENNLKAKCCFQYNAVNTGIAAITLYKTEVINPQLPGVPVPLLQYRKEFTHDSFATLDEVRAFDRVFISAELTAHAPDYNEKTWQINYDHEDIPARYCILAGDRVIGIAGCLDNFSGNTSSLQFLSCTRLSEDRTYHSDRFSYHLFTLLKELSSLYQQPLSFQKVI